MSVKQPFPNLTLLQSPISFSTCCIKGHGGTDKEEHDSLDCAIGIGKLAHTALGNYDSHRRFKKIRAIGNHTADSGNYDSQNDCDCSEHSVGQAFLPVRFD